MNPDQARHFLLRPNPKDIQASRNPAGNPRFRVLNYEGSAHSQALHCEPKRIGCRFEVLHISTEDGCVEPGADARRFEDGLHLVRPLEVTTASL